MLHSGPLVFFFQLLNVGVLIALGYYLFKKYVKAKLEEKVSQKEAVLKGLEEQGYFLEGRAHDLRISASKQDRLAVGLKQKLDDWKYEVVQEHFKMQEEYRIFAAANAGRMQIKNKTVEQHAWAKQLEPQLLAQAQKIIKKEFADSSKSAGVCAYYY